MMNGQKEFVLHEILPLGVLEVFKSLPATVGTAAHDYITKALPIAKVEQDARYLGAVPQPDGVLLLFEDGSTVLYQESNKIN